jgi:hypothetical protein
LSKLVSFRYFVISIVMYSFLINNDLQKQYQHQKKKQKNLYLELILKMQIIEVFLL